MRFSCRFFVGIAGRDPRLPKLGISLQIVTDRCYKE